MAKSNYAVAIGHGNAIGSLVAFDPQPRSLGIKYTRRNYLGGGGFLDEGPYIELLWSALADDAQYRAVLTQLGLVTAPYRDVSVSVRDDLWNYHLYDGVAHRPQLGQEADWQFMPQNVVVLIRDLVFRS